MKKLVNEFREFIQRGSVMDLAVGMIMGTAFNSIVTSLVNDIIMPVIGAIIGGQHFAGLSITIKDASIQYGNFIQNIVDFLIVAFCLFYIIKMLNKLQERAKKLEKKQKEEEKPAEPVKSEETLLLEEIRDLLKKQNKKN